MSAHILIFDSGLGGTTVFDEIHQSLPHCQFSYALDDAAFPYGDKTSVFLLDRIIQLIGKLIDASQPDIIVIACNTASTLTLERLRERFNIPFVGVVPAIKPAAAESYSRHIALLATNATIKGEYIDVLESQFANDCSLHRLPSQELVAIAEQKMLGMPTDLAGLEIIIQQLASQPNIINIDTLILGCTHFPALKDEIQMLWPKPIHIIDSGRAIANRVADLLTNISVSHNTHRPTVYTTGDYSAPTLLEILLPYGIKDCEKIAIVSQI